MNEHDWWQENEFIIKDAATHVYWFNGPCESERDWEGRKPRKNDYIYFIDYKGVLFYVGSTRNPAHRFTDQPHHAVKEWSCKPAIYHYGHYGYRCKATLLPLKKVKDVLGFSVPTLEVAESIFIDLCKDGECVELINKKISQDIYIQ